jgi:hypothetical protein
MCRMREDGCQDLVSRTAKSREGKEGFNDSVIAELRLLQMFEMYCERVAMHPTHQHHANYPTAGHSDT